MKETELRICEECGGSGFTVQLIRTQICCNAPTSWGNCCGNGIPEWTEQQVQCKKCQASGVLTDDELSVNG
jgi:DnaJ-class molecular chaperone